MDLHIILSLVWWLLLGVLLMGYAIMDGFDMGVASMLPYAGRKDMDRRIIINTIGPVWEGNQIWLVLGGGAIFAAFAPLYALSFSGFYLAMMLILFALILRPAAFKFRSKVSSPIWRNIWDGVLVFSGVVPALVAGVAMGNVLLGVPFSVDPSNAQHLIYDKAQGHLFYLLFNPNGMYVFTLLTGLTSVAMCLMQGGNYLALKTEGSISERAAKASRFSAMLTLVLFAVCGLFVAFVIKGYVVDPDNFFRIGPLEFKFLATELKVGGWLENYSRYPYFILSPVLAVVGILLSILWSKKEAFGKAFIASSVAIIGLISTVGGAVFPFFLPSSLEPSNSLIIFNSANSERTLTVMTIVALIFVPIVLAYTSWVYHVLRGTVTEKDINANKQSY